jgi:hypothetical protein
VRPGSADRGLRRRYTDSAFYPIIGLSDAISCDTGNGSAPGVMTARARAVHHRERSARREYYRGDNQ